MSAAGACRGQYDASANAAKRQAESSIVRRSRSSRSGVDIPSLDVRRAPAARLRSIDTPEWRRSPSRSATP